MSLRRNKGGFIFSFDATLAVLVAIIVVAGVARVGGPELIYGQHGYLRLERYANDALEVLQLTGTMDTIVNYVKHGYLENAEKLAETELRKILPRDVQFRLVVGDESNPRLDNVYPSAGKHAEWYATFQNAGEVATAVRASTLPPRERLKVLAWVDDNDENFMNMLESCTNLDVTRTSSVDTFWNELQKHLAYQVNYHVVFIPDAQVYLNDIYHVDYALIQYAVGAGTVWQGERWGGRIVVGGETLRWNYQDPNHHPDLWRVLGVQWDGNPPSVGTPLDNMRIFNGDNFVTAPYDNGDNISYNENYSHYVYTPTDNEWVVGRWELTPPVAGIIVRPADYTITLATLGIQTLKDPAVLFNMRFAQSATDLDNPMGTADWITLAKRAIGYEEVLELITLYVWRGEAVS